MSFTAPASPDAVLYFVDQLKRKAKGLSKATAGLSQMASRYLLVGQLVTGARGDPLNRSPGQLQKAAL